MKTTKQSLLTLMLLGWISCSGQEVAQPQSKGSRFIEMQTEIAAIAGKLEKGLYQDLSEGSEDGRFEGVTFSETATSELESMLSTLETRVVYRLALIAATENTGVDISEDFYYLLMWKCFDILAQEPGALATMQLASIRNAFGSSGASTLNFKYAINEQMKLEQE